MRARVLWPVLPLIAVAVAVYAASALPGVSTAGRPESGPTAQAVAAAGLAGASAGSSSADPMMPPAPTTSGVARSVRPSAHESGPTSSPTAARTSPPTLPAVSIGRTDAPALPAAPTTRPVTPRVTVATGAMPRPQTSAEAAVFASVNQERAANGLPPLAWSTQLALSAQRHCDAMVTTGTLSHQLPGEPVLSGRTSAAGFPGATVAENVGESSDPSQAGALALEDYLYRDPPHRANILATAMTSLGISVDVDAHGNLWLTEDFGRA